MHTLLDQNGPDICSFSLLLTVSSAQVLACLDGYMNIALEQTEEYANGQVAKISIDHQFHRKPMFSTAKSWLLRAPLRSGKNLFAAEEQVRGRLHQGQQRPLHLHRAQAVEDFEGQYEVENVLLLPFSIVQCVCQSWKRSSY